MRRRDAGKITDEVELLAVLWSAAVLHVLVSAGLTAIAQPSDWFLLGIPLPGLVALVPLLLALKAAPDQVSARRLGMLYGAVSTAFTSYWLLFFQQFSVWTLGGTVIGYVLYHFLLSQILWWSLHLRPGERGLVTALVLLGYEYLKSVGFLGYPWALHAYPLARFPMLLQSASIAGVWAVSFVVILVNVGVAEALAAAGWQRATEKPGPDGLLTRVGQIVSPALPFLLVALVILVSGFASLPTDTSRMAQLESRRTRIALVQHNADAWEGDPVAASAELMRLTRNAIDREPDVVVWSETALSYPWDSSFHDRFPQGDSLRDFARSLEQPLITGVPLVEQIQPLVAYNAALMLEQGRIVDWYGKRQLVPFAERVPFRESPIMQYFMETFVGLPGGGWATGPRVTVFTLPGPDGPVRAVTPICFEDGFPNVVRDMVLRDADLLLNLTNNSWSRSRGAQSQHLVAAMFRAIETRRPLVRGTNSGITVVVEPDGTLRDELPMFTPGYSVSDVRIHRGMWTPYLAIGDLLPQLAILAVFGWMLWFSLRSGRVTPKAIP